MTGLDPDCGRSQGGPCRGAIRPIEASKASVHNVRFTSIAGVPWPTTVRAAIRPFATFRFGYEVLDFDH